ncbi:MAG: hypothetical protein ACK4NF_05445 [Planctomycetota bacterium]
MTLKDSQQLADLHSKKKNTPTMGGIIFLLPVIFLIKAGLYPELFLILSYFIIGLTDDILKLKSRSLGIRVRLWFEFLLVFFYLLYKLKIGELHPVLQLSPSHHLHLSYYFYILFTSFIFVGLVNSFNITDGVDGLLGSLVIQILIMSLFTFSRFQIDYPVIRNIFFSLLGIVVSFLVFNFPPARIFMGNVGSITLATIVTILYILYNLHLVVLFSCFILLVNTFSVIIQSFSFRVFQKRVFPIAPFHHTLEFKNFSPVKIILIYFFGNLIVSLFFNILFFQ